MQSYSQLTLFCQDFITELQKNVGSQFHKRFAIYKKNGQRITGAFGKPFETLRVKRFHLQK